MSTATGSITTKNVNARQINPDSLIKQNRDEWITDATNVALVDKQGKALVKGNPR